MCSSDYVLSALVAEARRYDFIYIGTCVHYVRTCARTHTMAIMADAVLALRLVEARHYNSKEAYTSVKIGLYLCQKRPGLV